MRPQLVFNDLSVREAPSRQRAAHWFSDMMRTVADLVYEGVCDRLLHTNRSLYEIDLVPDEYGFQEWVSEASTDRDLRTFAGTLSDHSPVTKGLYETLAKIDEFEHSDFCIDGGLPCEALGVALTWDGIAISLPSEDRWRATGIPISQRRYDADLNLTDDGLVRHRVRHASLPDHVDPVIDDWRASASTKVTGAAQLIDDWELLFPRLDLCEEYPKKTLPELSESTTLRSVAERLYALNLTCQRWADCGEGSPEYGFRARPESRATMANQGLADQRLATCPRRGTAHFVMHCNIQPKGFRLYWLENQKDHRCCIGYVGPHLETSRYKAK